MRLNSTSSIGLYSVAKGKRLRNKGNLWTNIKYKILLSRAEGWQAEIKLSLKLRFIYQFSEFFLMCRSEVKTALEYRQLN